MTSTSRRSPIQYREAVNEDPCGGRDNVSNGCQVVFPRMEPGGRLCFLCVKLQNPELSGAAKDEIRVSSLSRCRQSFRQLVLQDTYVQCNECGICGTVVTDPCGTCRRAGVFFGLPIIFEWVFCTLTIPLANYEAGIRDQDRDRGAERRHLNLTVKMNKSSNNNNAVGTTTSMHELQAIHMAQGIGSPSQRPQTSFCIVYYECRRSDSAKHIDQTLGTGVISFPEAHTMLGMLSLPKQSFSLPLPLSSLVRNSSSISDCKGSERTLD